MAGARPTGWKSYDSVADAYERLTPPLFGAIARDLVDLLAPAVHAAVLDAGTGTGVAAEAVGAVVGPPGIVVGVDPSLEMLRLACARARLLAAATASRLPFADSTFDVVVANLVLSHFPDVEAGAAELGRVLRVGGRLAASAWPEHRDEPESDGPEVSRVVEAALDDVGLAVEPPETERPAPAEDWLRDAGNLLTVLHGAGLEDVELAERTHRRRWTPADALGWSLWGSRGRYLRSITDASTWDRFRRSALAALEDHFADGVRSVWTVRLAVGTKHA